MVYEATCTAPVNIAVIKYWGKRDLPLNLPTNSSLSVTLSQDDLKSTTTVRADESFGHDKLWLNGVQEEIKAGSRLAKCIEGMRGLRRKLEKETGGNDDKALSSLPIHIVSENNFPTAAGLASSASGFAALVYTIATLYQLPSSPSELSKIARTGSGSACRSLFGGYVAWEMGAQTDGEDSLAVQVAPVEHWSEMDAIVCVVSDAKKGTPSTAGMQQTIATSALAEHRIKYVVPERMTLISDAIKNHDFDTFAQITMKDSNQFHAICLDTDPPIFYLNDVSRAIIAAVTELNRASLAAGQGYLAAYTFDAGPNAVIYALRKDSKAIVNLITRYFPIEYDDKQKLFAGANEKPGTLPLPMGFNSAVIPTFPSGSVKQIIHSRVGDGPRKLGGESSLIGSNGLPKKLAGQ